MPKRKRTIDDDFEEIRKKINKLERELDKSRQSRRRIRKISSSSSSPPASASSSRSASPSPQDMQDEDKQNTPTTDDRDLLSQTRDAITQAASTSGAPGENATDPTTSEDIMDSLLLEILGEDPSTTIEYGPEIHKDLASRFEHIATSGLEASQRKELFAKYPTPSNCTHVAAPILNAEIKAALPENMVKRDKSFEIKQKQLATAISCLASVMTEQFTSTQINQGLLQKLMDTTRMLCDIQHTDSKTRRNFAMFSVKKEMKEHLSNTKIDKFLFGDNLAEALRTAKAVSKSGTDLKYNLRKFKKPTTQNNKFQPAGKNLNWKAPGPAGRPQGPPPATKNREPAYRRNQHATSSRRSSPPPMTTRRR